MIRPLTNVRLLLGGLIAASGNLHAAEDAARMLSNKDPEIRLQGIEQIKTSGHDKAEALLEFVPIYDGRWHGLFPLQGRHSTRTELKLYNDNHRTG